MGLIYLDTCLIIYLAEEHPTWAQRTRQAMAVASDTDFAISALVKCECLVGPLKSGNLILEQQYRALFERFLSLPMPESVFLQAAELRARFGLQTPDALHLACAQQHHCDALWTHDDRLARASLGLAQSVLTQDDSA